MQWGVNYSSTGWLHGQPGHSPAGRTLGAAGSVCALPSHISFFCGVCDLHMHKCCGGMYSWVWTVAVVKVGGGTDNIQLYPVALISIEGENKGEENLTPLLTSPADQ